MLNVTHRNSLEDENDTWVRLSDQYLDVARGGFQRSGTDHPTLFGRNTKEG